ncbi:MAG: O-antigen ligase family protein [Chitinophagia bacterium]|nr:O-antigen ligase family protein [Chitinophagia bacterium]
MKKSKKYSPKAPQPVEEAAINPVSTSANRQLAWIPIILAAMFFGVEWIGTWNGIEYLGSQWLYLMMVNSLVILYIFSQKDSYAIAIRSIFSSAFIWVYVLLFIWALFSFFYALNATETLVCLVRLATAIISLINLSILFSKQTSRLIYVAGLATFFLFVQSAISLLYFFKGSSELSFTDLVLTMRMNAGNKNIYAASLGVKLPFVLFGIYYYKNFIRILFSIVFFLAATTIFLLSSRTSIIAVSASVIAYLFISVIAYFKEKNVVALLSRFVLIVVLVIFSVICSRVATNFAKYNFNDSSNIAAQYGTVDETVAAIANKNNGSTQERFVMWKAAWDYTQKHPITGAGFGNWKLASIPYSREYNDGLIVPIHAHNDFLEYFAELGFPGGILYAAIFLILCYYGIRTFLQNPIQVEGIFTIFSLVAVIVFTIDSSLNFPKEEPMNQVLFAFCGMGVLVGYLNFRDSISANMDSIRLIPSLAPIYSFVLGIIMLPILYIGFLVWRSSIAQNLYVQELNAVTLTAPVDQVVNAFPSIPNLVSNTVQPIEGMLGMYLWKNGQTNEAERYLRKGAKANPYMMYVENIRANMYYQKGQWDSAAYFAILCFQERPRNPTYYQTYMACIARTYDTASLRVGFELYNKYHPKDSFCWNLYLNNMLNASQGADKHLKDLADTALNLFPGDVEIKKRNQEITNAYALKR